MQETQLMKVIFKGEVLIGQDIHLVKKKLAEKFKLNSETVDRLFSGKTITIKKEIEREEALKYREAFKQAGAKCYIEWMDPDYFEKHKLPSETVTKIITCPKCGKTQERGDTCIDCDYPLAPSVHANHNLFTLAYDTLREHGVPKWAIIAGFCVIFFGLIVPMFIPKGSKEILELSKLDISHFPTTTSTQAYPIYRWDFGRRKNLTYDFERIYKKAASLNAYDTESDETQHQDTDPLSSNFRVTGKLSIRSSGNQSAEIVITNCKQAVKYGTTPFDFYKYDAIEIIPDIQISRMQEDGRIESAVSSDCAYLNELFRIPESLEKSGESKSIDIEMHYQGRNLTGTLEATLEDYIVIKGRSCAKIVENIHLNSGQNNFEDDYFQIDGILNVFFDPESRSMVLAQLKQTINKNTYEMYEGFYTWVTSSHQETVTVMKKGLAKNLSYIR